MGLSRMHNWRETTWGDEVILEYGKGIRGYSKEQGGYRVFGSNGPIGWTDKALAKGPGVILGRKGAYRGVHYSHEDFFVIDTAYYVKPLGKLDMRWLFYAVTYSKLGEIDDGSPIPSTTRAAVYVRDLSVPPHNEQKAIASILGAFDDKIDCNRRMNETLEAMARAMFKDWFVDFGPTRAKMEGRAPYLAPEIWSLFPDRLDDEGKPEGWNHASLSHFFTILGGGTPKTTEQKYWGGRILWFSVVDAPTGGDVYVIQTEKHITPQGLEGSSAQLVPAGTTIISARGTVGKLAMAAQEMTFNQSCYGLRRVPPVGDVFVYMAAKHMVSKLRQMSHGAVFSTITRQTFEAISLPAPQPQLLETFEDTASPFFDQIKANVLQSLSLAQTRDLLLPKLMSGEIRVKDAEKAVGDVL